MQRCVREILSLMWYIISAVIRQKTYLLVKSFADLMKFLLILLGRITTVCNAPSWERSRNSKFCSCSCYLIFVCVFGNKILRFTDCSDYNTNPISCNIWQGFAVSSSQSCIFHMYMSAWGQACIVKIFEILSVLHRLMNIIIIYLHVFV